MGRFDHKQYVELTMHFRCNLKCEHCMIEGTMDWLEPETFTRLKQVIAHNLEERCWKGLILTGAEITLRRDLPELARLARQRLRPRSHPDPWHAPRGPRVLRGIDRRRRR